jgi:hypothetical protein
MHVSKKDLAESLVDGGLDACISFGLAADLNWRLLEELLFSYQPKDDFDGFYNELKSYDFDCLKAFEVESKRKLFCRKLFAFLKDELDNSAILEEKIFCTPIASNMRDI